MKNTLFGEMGLFQKYDEKEMQNIALSKYASHKTIAKGRTFLRQGSAYESLYITTEGSAKVEMAIPEGESLVIQTLHSPFVIAPAILFGDKRILPVSIISKTKLHVAVIKKADVLKMLSSNSKMLNIFLNKISNKVHFLSKRLYTLSLRSIRAKLSYFFISLSEETQSNTIRLPYSVSELADYFAVSRPSLSTVLGDMQKEKIIRKEKDKVTIRKKSALKMHFI